MRLFHYFTLAVAIAISICAAYYSIVGLTAIFAASVIPIIIMGSILELAKVTGAVWLKLFWKDAVWWIKLYLTPAVAVLMLITSMGIFGFLSKAHIEQTAAAGEGIAKIEIITKEITRQQDLIKRSEETIKAAETKGTSSDASIQAQIDKEQARIDSVNTRIQPAIDEQNAIIAKEEQRLGGGVSVLEDQVKQIDADLAKLDQYLADNNIRMAQTLTGAPVDGKVGNKTSLFINDYRTKKEAAKTRLAKQIAAARSKLSSTVITAAQEEIKRIRAGAEKEIADSTALIAKLRSQIGQAATTVDVNAVVAAEGPKIEAANTKITQLTEEKYALEAQARKLEAEVGPIKYVAELIYGNADNSMLEAAVRWMILLLVAVFDPLAIILTMAAITGLASSRKKEIKVPEPTPEPAQDSKKNLTRIQIQEVSLPESSSRPSESPKKRSSTKRGPRKSKSPSKK